MTQSLQNLRDEIQSTSKKAAIAWICEYGLLHADKYCHYHGKPITLCDEEIPLPFDKAVTLIYCFARDFSCTDTVHELSDFTLGNDFVVLLSFATIAVWFYYRREMIVGHFLNIMGGNRNYRRISGAGSLTIAQIDQAKFDKQKYNRGSRVVSQS